MWRFRANNPICEEKERLHVHKVHLERLLESRPHVQMNGPDLPYFLKNKLSLKEILRCRAKKINYENFIIFSRLQSVSQKPSPYSRIYTPAYCPAYDKKKHNFDKKERAKEIYNQNNYYYTRFAKEKPHYSTKALLDLNDYENYLRGNIKRQHLANPNLEFCTYNAFKQNVFQGGQKLVRCGSAKSVRRENNLWEIGPYEESKDQKNFWGGRKKITWKDNDASRNKSFNEGQHGSLMFGQSGLNSKKTNNNESNGCYNNTNYTSKIPNTPQTAMKRSQSAYGLRNKGNAVNSKNNTNNNP